MRFRVNVKDKEGRMRNRQRGSGIGLATIAVAAMAALIAVAVASAGGTGQAACGTVTLNENSWVGSTANVYVVKNVLEKKLKCSVKVTNITENQPSFQAMADGKIDVVLEDWDNTLVPSNKKYLTSKSVVPVGGNGITGVIGWYIPRYLLKQYPQFKTWRGLKGKESVFKTPESLPNAGTFLGGDPSYVQKDRALIKELGLDLKHVVSGAEPAQVARWTTLYKQHKPVLFYWYDPQYLNAIYDLYRIQLPEAVQGLHRRREDEGQPRLRVRGVPDTRQARLEQVLEERFARAEGHQEVQLDLRGSELRRRTSSRGSTWTRTKPPQYGWPNKATVNSWLK